MVAPHPAIILPPSTALPDDPALPFDQPIAGLVEHPGHRLDSPVLQEELVDELPDARLRILNNSKHALPTERPEACAAMVRRFIDYVTSGRKMTPKIATVDPITAEMLTTTRPAP